MASPIDLLDDPQKLYERGQAGLALVVVHHSRSANRASAVALVVTTRSVGKLAYARISALESRQ
jgi:hypothetical protein